MRGNVREGVFVDSVLDARAHSDGGRYARLGAPCKRGKQLASVGLQRPELSNFSDCRAKRLADEEQHKAGYYSSHCEPPESFGRRVEGCVEDHIARC